MATPCSSFVRVGLGKTAQAPFTEWQVAAGGAYLEDVDIAESGTFWMVRGDATLTGFEPSTNLASVYALPGGTVAMSVEASGHGGIVFLEWTQNALGDLDTATGTVNLWPIPGAIHPVDIARDAWSGIWFVDREADVIGYLDRDANTYYLYDLLSDSSPVAIVPGQDGFDLWFVAEHGDYIGKLCVVRGP